MDYQSLTAIVATVMGSQVLTTIAQGYFNRRKESAEAEKTTVDSAQILVDQVMKWATSLTSRIEKLEAELMHKDQQIADLKAHISKLEARMP